MKERSEETKSNADWKETNLKEYNASVQKLLTNIEPILRDTNVAKESIGQGIPTLSG